MKHREENIVEIVILIARIIMLILSGMSSVGAVSEVAKASGIASATLWNRLPNRFK
jgi:DNA invertase Pin-like site-specific DNA recombinase